MQRAKAAKRLERARYPIEDNPIHKHVPEKPEKYLTQGELLLIPKPVVFSLAGWAALEQARSVNSPRSKSHGISASSSKRAQ